jgi:hypothetical protein
MIIRLLHSTDASKVNGGIDNTGHTDLDDCDVDIVGCGLWKSM